MRWATATGVDSDLSNALEFDETRERRLRRGEPGPRQGGDAGGSAPGACQPRLLRCDGESYPHDYTSLFPSALVSYKLNDKTLAKVSYSRRIRRPGTQELNPFPSFFDVQQRVPRQPGAGPGVHGRDRAGLQRSGKLGSLQFSPFYRHTTDVIRVDINTADTVANREVTVDQLQEPGDELVLGRGPERPVPRGQVQRARRLQRVQDGDGWRQRVDAVVGCGDLDRRASTARTTSRQDTMFQVNYFYRAPMNIERGRFHSVSGTQVVARQKLNERAFVSLRMNDVFKTNKFRVQVGDDNIIQLTHRQFNSRALFLTLQYNVGQTPRIRQRQEEQQAASPFGR